MNDDEQPTVAGLDDEDPAHVYRFLRERRRRLVAEDDGMQWEISGGMIHGSLRDPEKAAGYRSD